MTEIRLLKMSLHKKLILFKMGLTATYLEIRRSTTVHVRIPFSDTKFTVLNIFLLVTDYFF